MKKKYVIVQILNGTDYFFTGAVEHIYFDIFSNAALYASEGIANIILKTLQICCVCKVREVFV